MPKQRPVCVVRNGPFAILILIVSQTIHVSAAMRARVVTNTNCDLYAFNYKPAESSTSPTLALGKAVWNGPVADGARKRSYG